MVLALDRGAVGTDERYDCVGVADAADFEAIAGDAVIITTRAAWSARLDMAATGG